MGTSYGRTIGGMGHCRNCGTVQYFFNKPPLTCSVCDPVGWRERLRRRVRKLRQREAFDKGGEE